MAESSIRVDVDLLDSLMRQVGELVLCRNQIVRQAGMQDDVDLVRASQRLNLIASELPVPRGGGAHLSNSDPVTGQAGWYDVRVRIYPAAPEEPEQTAPQFVPMQPLPGTSPVRRLWQAYFAGSGDKK